MMAHPRQSRIPICSAILGWFLSVLAFAQGGPSILAPGATLKKTRDGFQFTEGPAADTQGNIFFSDVRAERAYESLLWRT